MTLRGTRSLLVVTVAVSSAAWSIVTSAQATAGPLPWAPMVVALLSHVAAVAAAVLVLRASGWWRRAALAYMAAFAALEAVGLVQIWPFASQYETYAVVWSIATSLLAVTAAVLCVRVLRRMDVGGDGSVPSPLRWAAVTAGLLLVASSVFAWSVSSQAPPGRWMFTLGLASTGVLVGSLVGMAVVTGITAVLAAGWWIALAAQLLLVAVLAALVRRGAGRSHGARELAPTT